MPAPALASPHLLVVEAVPALRLVFHDELAEMGYASALASSLEHALGLLHQQPVDLMVADTSYITSLQDALDPLRPLLTLSHPLPIVLCAPLPLSETEVRQAGFASWVQPPVPSRPARHHWPGIKDRRRGVPGTACD
jgi:CheY-like chemotaxis protein